MDDDSLIERMKTSGFEEGTRINIVLKKGARWLYCTLPCMKEKGFGAPSKDEHAPGVSCSGRLYCYSLDVPRRIYVTPFWDVASNVPTQPDERYYIDEQAIYSVDDDILGRGLLAD